MWTCSARLGASAVAGSVNGGQGGRKTGEQKGWRRGHCCLLQDTPPSLIRCFLSLALHSLHGRFFSCLLGAPRQGGRREFTFLGEERGRVLTSTCSHFCASLLATPPPCSQLWPLGRESMGSWPVFAEETEVVTEVTVNLNCSYFSMLSVSAALNSLLQNCLDQVLWYSRWYLITSQAF